LESQCSCGCLACLYASTLCDTGRIRMHIFVMQALLCFVRDIKQIDTIA